MNLDDFEDTIDPPIILMRGRAYYHEGCVLSLETIGPNHYRAFVAGSQVYQVSIVLDDDRDIEELSCTCPYDWGEHCKHEVAVLYALRHQLSDTENENKDEDKEADTETMMVERRESVDLTSLLDGVSKEALVAFLVEFAKKSPALVSGLVLAFPSSDDEVNQDNLGIEFRRACSQGAEITYFGRDYAWEDENVENYIWHFTSTFTQKVEELCEIIRVAIMEGRIRHAGAIASMMVHELSSFDCDTDHLGEDVEATVSQIALLFNGVVPSLEDSRWLFAQFLAEAKHYDSKPMAILLGLCIHFAEAKDDQEVLENYLVALAAEASEGTWGHNLTIRISVELRHSLLLKQGRVEEAQAFALEHLQYDSLRKLAFDHAMTTGEYAVAERLAEEKVHIGRQHYMSPDWGELLFKVYQESGNTEKMRSLSRRFLLGDKLAYYPILKACYGEGEWETVVVGLLDELEAHDVASKGYRENTYPEVLRGEKKLERLLAYVQTNPYAVRHYQDELLPLYQDEVFLLYKQVILSDGETVASRNEYRGLASWFESLASLGGSYVVKECLEALEPRYKKRPALKDELRKVGVL